MLKYNKSYLRRILMKKYILTLLLIIVIPLFVISCDSTDNDDSNNVSVRQPIVKQYGDLSIHFLELGNRYTGDCVYIKYKNIDIVIDAGSKQTSAATITEYINMYIQDNKLEYVIATHGHEDHIAGFYSTSTVKGVLETYEIGTIIDFPRTNSTSATYNHYQTARANAVARGAVHFNALQCYREEIEGAKRIFDLGDDVKLEILYNYYYENPSVNNENNYSVCVRIIQGERQYLFTGDLEKDAEDRLVDYYQDNYGGLGHAVLYKGGHHGSNTSSNEKLMEEIKPEYVCVCSCVGTSQYTFYNPNNVFPSQGFINRVAPYTDKIYITTLITDYQNNIFTSFNGDIVFLVSDDKISVICSNNDDILKDTEWFKNNRTLPDAWK